jgi:hypothetical protein
MNIEELPPGIQQLLTPDDVNFLTSLDLLLPGDLYDFEVWLTNKCNEPVVKSQEEEQKTKRKNWATFKIIADDLGMTELSIRRAIDICFKTWNKKHLRDYSEQSMIQNMEYNLKRFAEKDKPTVRTETAEKMRLFAHKYYFSVEDKRWYFRETKED